MKLKVLNTYFPVMSENKTFVAVRYKGFNTDYWLSAWNFTMKSANAWHASRGTAL